MLKSRMISTLLIGSLAIGPLVGCETIEDNPRTSGTAIGGVAGAAAGALIGGSDNRLLGALIGGALGAGGGYLIGSSVDKSDEKHRDDAIKADRRARQNPVSIEQARTAATADINSDGYVTMDEVVALRQANLSNREMINKLQATGQFFELTSEQQQYLRDRGVDQEVISAMLTMNQDARNQALQRQSTNSGNLGNTRSGASTPGKLD